MSGSNASSAAAAGPSARSSHGQRHLNSSNRIRSQYGPQSAKAQVLKTAKSPKEAQHSQPTQVAASGSESHLAVAVPSLTSGSAHEAAEAESAAAAAAAVPLLEQLCVQWKALTDEIGPRVKELEMTTTKDLVVKQTKLQQLRLLRLEAGAQLAQLIVADWLDPQSTRELSEANEFWLTAVLAEVPHDVKAMCDAYQQMWERFQVGEDFVLQAELPVRIFVQQLQTAHANAKRVTALEEQGAGLRQEITAAQAATKAAIDMLNARIELLKRSLTQVKQENTSLRAQVSPSTPTTPSEDSVNGKCIQRSDSHSESADCQNACQRRTAMLHADPAYGCSRCHSLSCCMSALHVACVSRTACLPGSKDNANLVEEKVEEEPEEVQLKVDSEKDDMEAVEGQKGVEFDEADEETEDDNGGILSRTYTPLPRRARDWLRCDSLLIKAYVCEAA